MTFSRSTVSILPTISFSRMDQPDPRMELKLLAKCTMGTRGPVKEVVCRDGFALSRIRGFADHGCIFVGGERYTINEGGCGECVRSRSLTFSMWQSLEIQWLV